MKRIFIALIAAASLSACSFNLFSNNSRAHLAGPVQKSPAAPAAGSDLVAEEYLKDFDFEINYPASYFVTDPKVLDIACDIAKECPCVYDPQYGDRNDFCARIAPSVRDGEFCVQKWSEGAAGSTYTNYAYTRAAKDSTGRCASLRFAKRSVTSCSVYEGNDANVKNCEAEKAMIPVMIERIVASWKMLSPRPSDRSAAGKRFQDLLNKDWKTCINEDMGFQISYPGEWKSCSGNSGWFTFETDYQAHKVEAVAEVYLLSGSEVAEIESDMLKPAGERDYYYEQTPDGTAFKEYGFGGPFDRNGIILDGSIYRFVWTLKSDQKPPAGLESVWTPDNDITTEELFNIVKSAKKI